MENNTIYNEDCLDTLSRIKDNTIDFVLTSPPYNKNAYATDKGPSLSWQAMRGRQIPYDIYSDNMPPEKYEEWQRLVIQECIRVLKPTGSMIYNHKDIAVNGLIIHPKWVYDYNLHQKIIWNRGSSVANDPHYFQPVTEYLFWIVKDRKKFYFNKENSLFKKNIWDIPFEINTNHPAPFPLKLARNAIISCCIEGGVVYDPFMGSGTTAVAASMEGRRYIGSEISQKYVDIANNRIKSNVSQLVIF